MARAPHLSCIASQVPPNNNFDFGFVLSDSTDSNPHIKKIARRIEPKPYLLSVAPLGTAVSDCT